MRCSSSSTQALEMPFGPSEESQQARDRDEEHFQDYLASVGGRVSNSYVEIIACGTLLLAVIVLILLSVFTPPIDVRSLVGLMLPNTDYAFDLETYMKILNIKGEPIQVVLGSRGNSAYKSHDYFLCPNKPEEYFFQNQSTMQKDMVYTLPFSFDHLSNYFTFGTATNVNFISLEVNTETAQHVQFTDYICIYRKQWKLVHDATLDREECIVLYDIFTSNWPSTINEIISCPYQQGCEYAITVIPGIIYRDMQMELQVNLGYPVYDLQRCTYMHPGDWIPPERQGGAWIVIKVGYGSNDIIDTIGIRLRRSNVTGYVVLGIIFFLLLALVVTGITLFFIYRHRYFGVVIKRVSRENEEQRRIHSRIERISKALQREATNLSSPRVGQSH
ncbi:Transmembrane domain-containing protein [Giardia muris]|uniref:Transmembrane domain-containing protein n=1 Tax=Giardia muris TaxID=5742 RepID=A0A4Z1SLC9_GIAMU|nr:Transmembrane domain-containing protein [Giardia muris]|eukprot:TNJ26310.1 Transmembrane domain-containing protein [Giardia muris]